MIFRLSHKLSTKIKAATLSEMPLDDNPYADWSCNLFIVDRAQYIILSNTPSLYSMILLGKGVPNTDAFVDRALSGIREFTEYDGQAFDFERFIAPAIEKVSFAKALSRSVTGSMNDLIYHAKMWLTEGELSPFDASVKLNEIPMSALDYANPREVFKSLAR
jgi:hypothetical protein